MNIIKSLFYGDSLPDPAFIARYLENAVTNNEWYNEVYDGHMADNSAEHSLSYNIHIYALATAFHVFVNHISTNNYSFPPKDKRIHLCTAIQAHLSNTIAACNYPRMQISDLYFDEADFDSDKTLIEILLQNPVTYRQTIAAERLFDVCCIVGAKKLGIILKDYGVENVTLKMSSIPKLSEAIAVYLVNVIYVTPSLLPSELWNIYKNLAAKMCGGINATINSQNFR